MINRYFQQRFALSPEGAKALSLGVLWSTLLNLALMLPTIYVFAFLDDYLHRTPRSLPHYLAVGVALMLVIFAVAMVQYRSTYTKIYTESAQRRITLAERLRKLPLAYFGRRDLTDLTTTLMEDSNVLETVFSHAIPQLFASLLSMLLALVALFAYEWRLALSLFWVVPLAASIMLLSRHKIKYGLAKVHTAKLHVSRCIQEGVEEIQEIKAYNGEGAYMEELNHRLEAYERGLLREELVAGGSVVSSHAVLRLGLATVVVVGAWLYGQGAVSLFTYVVFLLLGASVYQPIMEVFNNIAVLAFLDVRIDRQREMAAMPAQEGATDVEIEHFDLEFRDVHFAYDADRQVLRGVSFTARQGEVTALVGASGSGKSTAARLAARFWDIDGGTILLGGRNIADIDPESLLRHFSIVFQDVMLFNASVFDNIRLGRPTATDEEVYQAAKMAQCDEFVDRLPEGYATLIGENGERLSGGERQRISIARALLKDAPIILLDEATASLDVENETRIQAALSALIKDKTVIIIAHRMRTVAQAHHIVVLADGRVAEQGSPRELMERGTLFAKMVAQQQACE